MRRNSGLLIWLFLIALTVSSCNRENSIHPGKLPAVSDTLIVSLLESSLEQEEYFKLDRQYDLYKDQLSARDYMYFGGMVDNIFSDYSSSLQKLDRLEKKYGKRLSPLHSMHLHKALRMNYYHTYNYAGAYKETVILTSEYADMIDSVELSELLDDQRLLKAIRFAPPQVITLPGDISIPFKRDNWDSMLLKVDFGVFISDFLFDTGFSMSCMRRSLAEQTGLPIYDVDLPVAGATGEKALCDVIVVDSFYLGELLIRNSIFWVFDDKDLSLPEYDFYVNGVIGMPILQALGELKIYRDGKIFIPGQPGEYHLRNLAFTDLDPVIAVVENNDTMPFYFDTGASFSEFYHTYYEKNKERIEKQFERKTYRFGSLAGVKEFHYFLADSSTINVGGSSAELYNKGIHMESVYDDPEKVYGNLGSDFIKLFDAMTISFTSNSVFFE